MCAFYAFVALGLLAASQNGVSAVLQPVPSRGIGPMRAELNRHLMNYAAQQQTPVFDLGIISDAYYEFVDGDRTTFKGEFTLNGVVNNCEATWWKKARTNYEELTLKCDGKEYKVSSGDSNTQFN